MKYFKLHSLVDKFKVLVLKDFDDEYYVSSSNKRFTKDYIHDKINDGGWHYTIEISEEEFYEDVERLIKINERMIQNRKEDLIRLNALLKEREEKHVLQI